MDFGTAHAMAPTDQAREATIGALKDAYVRGALDDEELGRGIHVALTTRNAHDLESLISRPATPTTTGPRRSGWRLPGAALAASAVGVVLLGAGAMAFNPAPALDPPVCVSTGLSSEALECPAPTEEQKEIEQRAEVAASAAQQADVLAAEAPTLSELQMAAESAQAASARAQRALGQARAVMADSLGQDPPAGAFDQMLEDARAAARDALQALNAAEAALNG